MHFSACHPGSTTANACSILYRRSIPSSTKSPVLSGRVLQCAALLICAAAFAGKPAPAVAAATLQSPGAGATLAQVEAVPPSGGPVVQPAPSIASRYAAFEPFSANALAAIFADAPLRERLAGAMILLAPQRAEPHLRGFKAWNKAYPASPFHLAYRIGEFPAIDNWNTPLFYFTRDGVVVDKVEGWPRDGSRMAELRDALDRFEKP